MRSGWVGVGGTDEKGGGSRKRGGSGPPDPPPLDTPMSVKAYSESVSLNCIFFFDSFHRNIITFHTLGVPGPKPWPLIGNMAAMYRKVS